VLLPFIVGSAALRDPGHEVVPRAYSLPCGCEAYFILLKPSFSTSFNLYYEFRTLQRKFIGYVGCASVRSMAVDRGRYETGTCGVATREGPSSCIA
jgi:hypothetical protein